MFRPRGLRARVITAFGLGALLVTTAFAVLAYVLAHSYLLTQRERSVLRQVYTDATIARDQLETTGVMPGDVLSKLAPPTSTSIVIQWQGRWFASALTADRDSVPASIRSAVADGNAVHQRIDTGDDMVLVVGVPLPAAHAEIYEVVSMAELDETLQVLSTALTTGALLATAAGIGLGWWASRSVVRPLEGVASTAAQIAAGQLDTRLRATRDPDLTTIVGSFNSMVDTLQQRIERDARLAADVSHELRSPLTTLVAGVEMLNKRRDELPGRSRHALDLITAELDRFQQLLRNLLELARAEAGLDREDLEDVPVNALIAGTLAETGRSEDLLAPGAGSPLIRADVGRLQRVIVNVLDNADQHANGTTKITVTTQDTLVLICFDDAGPGISVADRERIFERFATGKGARGSAKGTGLGLALASETIAAHGGAMWCTDRPDGPGSRFVISLPRTGV
jgi:two-component system, OmpR family, sensor histidine kinase MtrB